jgi:hypothetical protein
MTTGRPICLVRLLRLFGYESHHPHGVTRPFVQAFGQAWMATLGPDVFVFEAHAAPYQSVLHCARAIRARACPGPVLCVHAEAHLPLVSALEHRVVDRVGTRLIRSNVAAP